MVLSCTYLILSYSTEIDDDDVLCNPKYDDEKKDTEYEDVVFCCFYPNISPHRPSLLDELFTFSGSKWHSWSIMYAPRNGFTLLN